MKLWKVIDSAKLVGVSLAGAAVIGVVTAGYFYALYRVGRWVIT